VRAGDAEELSRDAGSVAPDDRRWSADREQDLGGSAAGEVGGDLGAGALVVRARVGLVSVLERKVVARLALGQLQGQPDRAVRAFRAR
jgi:hypothetical protein